MNFGHILSFSPTPARFSPTFQPTQLRALSLSDRAIFLLYVYVNIVSAIKREMEKKTSAMPLSYCYDKVPDGSH